MPLGRWATGGVPHSIVRLSQRRGGRVNGKAARGRQAEWCDYSGTVDGLRAGVTLIADPGNFRPCWWHARDYGFICANPFGRHALTGGPASRVVVRKGDRFRLRYGVVVHDGTPGEGYAPAAAFRQYRSELDR